MRLVDNIWVCGCGAWNSFYRTECGKCKIKSNLANRLDSMNNKMGNINSKVRYIKDKLLVDLLVELAKEYPNDMEFGSKARLLMREKINEVTALTK